MRRRHALRLLLEHVLLQTHVSKLGLLSPASLSVRTIETPARLVVDLVNRLLARFDSSASFQLARSAARFLGVHPRRLEMSVDGRHAALPTHLTRRFTALARDGKCSCAFEALRVLYRFLRSSPARAVRLAILRCRGPACSFVCGVNIEVIYCLDGSIFSE